jgi:hypothetical protein
MSSVHITAARASQKAMLRTEYTGCPKCLARPSMAEVTERFCIECNATVEPESVTQRIIHKHRNINTGAVNAA